MDRMRRFVVEMTITEYRVLEISAETPDVAIAKAKDGFGRWMLHPSRLMEGKIIREITTENQNRNGTPD